MKRNIIALIALVAFVSSCAKEFFYEENQLSAPVEETAAQDAAGYLLGFGASAEGTRVSIKVPEKVRPSDKLFKIIKSE